MIDLSENGGVTAATVSCAGRTISAVEYAFDDVLTLQFTDGGSAEFSTLGGVCLERVDGKEA